MQVFNIFVFCFNRISMPKPNKRTRQSQDAIRKRWRQVEISNEILLSQDNELSDAEPDMIDESQFNTFWIEGEETQFDSNEITQSLQELQPNLLKQLVENAKRSHVWAEKSRGQIYKGAAESTLRN